MLRVDVVDDRGNEKSPHKPSELFGIHLPQFIRRTGQGEMFAVDSLVEKKNPSPSHNKPLILQADRPQKRNKVLGTNKDIWYLC